jgi:hypothetical protein
LMVEKIDEKFSPQGIVGAKTNERFAIQVI